MWFKSKDPRIGQAYIEEVLPRFHDRACTTNKTLYIVESIYQGNVVTSFDDEMPNLKKRIDLTSRKTLTQNGEPLLLKKRNKIIKQDVTFEKNGYRKGQIYSLKGLGFLGDIEDLKIVSLVTDDYIFFRSLNHKSLSIYKFKELEIILPTLIDHKNVG